MLNLSDKELDRLSREAAEKYEVGQDHASWHKLEQLLDKELGRPSPISKLPGPRTPFLYAPAIIILIGATYFLLKPSKHNSTSTQKNYTSVSTPPAGNTASRTPLPAPGASIKNEPAVRQGADVAKNHPGNKTGVVESTPSENLSQNASSEKNQSTEKKQSDGIAGLPEFDKKAGGKVFGENYTKEISGNAAVEKATKNKYGNPHPTVHQNAFVSSPENMDSKATHNTQQHTRQHPGDKNTVAGANDTKLTAKNNQQKSVDNNSLFDLKPAVISGIQPVSGKMSFAVNDSLLHRLQLKTAGINQQIITPGKRQKGRTLYTNRSLQFGFVLAPDFSEVRYDYNNKIGSNVGITVSYQLSGKVSVNSGFISTKKNYDVNGYDFHLPPNCGIDQADLDFAICTSHIYEIPLNLRYDVNKAGNTSFFVSTGLSSYIMGKENFKFYLHDNNIGYRRWESASYKINHTYWLSVLNLSAGFETKISNSFSVQAEPYIKLPFTGIGFGSVDLSSYGVNVSIKYAPLLKRVRR